jgi:hypothetical protein
VFAARQIAVAALFWLIGCDDAPAPPPPDQPPSASSLDPQFIDADIRDIYQVLLLNGLAGFEKAERWSRFYKQRWVRWTGQLTHIKPDSLWFRQMEGTMTYDVMLKTARAPGQAKPNVVVGRFYNYVGRLDRYDDGFGSIYLDQGVVFDAGPDGVPGTLITVPIMTRHVPGPPKSIPPPLPR